MNKLIISALSFLLATSSFSQNTNRNYTQAPAPAATPSAPAPASDSKSNANNIPFNPDATVVSDHEITIKGVRVPYKATAGMMPVWDPEGKVQAGVFFTYYERSDVKDRASRPLVISFNGGPGTPSVWMELGLYM